MAWRSRREDQKGPIFRSSAGFKQSRADLALQLGEGESQSQHSSSMNCPRSKQSIEFNFKFLMRIAKFLKLFDNFIRLMVNAGAVSEFVAR
jgi:hypothetical protein